MDFSFEGEQVYFPDQIHCESGQITVVIEDQIIPVVLFDIEISEEGQQRACQIIHDAEVVRIELQPQFTHNLPLPVWMFADDQLVQKILLEHREARIAAANPTYLYMDQMLEIQNNVGAVEQTENFFSYARQRGQQGLFMLAAVLMILVVVKRRILR